MNNAIHLSRNRPQYLYMAEMGSKILKQFLGCNIKKRARVTAILSSRALNLSRKTILVNKDTVNAKKILTLQHS